MKTRLNKTHREKLLDLAIEKNQPTKEIKAEQKAYESFRKELLRCYEKEIPPSELAILKKHGQTKTRRTLFFTLHAKNDSTHRRNVELKKDDGFVTPYETQFWSSYLVAETNEGSRLDQYFNKWKSTKEELGAKRQSIKSDFEQLINGARTFEDVAEVWKGADKLKSEICISKSTALIDQDAVNRIKNQYK